VRLSLRIIELTFWKRRFLSLFDRHSLLPRHRTIQRAAVTASHVSAHFHSGRSDGRRGWNDGIQRPDDISFKVNEVFESG
jgi:hypothetical protein